MADEARLHLRKPYPASPKCLPEGHLEDGAIRWLQTLMSAGYETRTLRSRHAHPLVTITFIDARDDRLTEAQHMRTVRAEAAMTMAEAEQAVSNQSAAALISHYDDCMEGITAAYRSAARKLNAAGMLDLPYVTGLRDGMADVDCKPDYDRASEAVRGERRDPDAAEAWHAPVTKWNMEIASFEPAYRIPPRR